MRRFAWPALALSILLPAVAAATPALPVPLPVVPIPPGASWALMAQEAGRGADAAARLQQVADTRGLQQGFGAGLRRGLGFDPFDGPGLVAAGVDPGKPLAVARVGEVEVAAVHLADRDVGHAHLAGWLATVGEPAKVATHAGWKVHAATGGQAAYATRAAAAISVRQVGRGGDALATLRATIAAANGGASIAGDALWRLAMHADRASPWVAWIQRPGFTAAAAVGLEGQRLRLAGNVRSRQLGGLAARGAAYPAATPTGELLLARLRLAREDARVVAELRRLLTAACTRCDETVSNRLAAQIAAQLAGPAVLAVTQLDLAALARQGAGASATPSGWVAQVRDPARAGALVTRLAEAVGATAEPGGHRTETPAGTFHFGLRGDRLFVASEPAVRDRLLAASEGPASGEGMPLQLIASPAVAGRSLARLSLADALRGGAMAPLFALRLQLGPLLQGSGALSLEAQPAGRDVHNFVARWDLVAAPAPAAP